MDKVRIGGIPPYDGEYDFDPSYWTNRELHQIKQETGVRAGELQQAWRGGDNDIAVMVGVLAVQRSGRFDSVSVDAFWNAEIGSIEYVEGDAGPPDETPSPSSDGDDEKP